MANSLLWCVSAAIPAGTEEPLLELLDDEGLWPTTHHDADSKRTLLNVYIEDAALVDAARGAVLRAASSLGLSLETTVENLPPENWRESWKRFFHTTRVSPRVVVRPMWEPYAAQPGEVVVDMEPGMSFGTGNHATTRACLQFLDALALENPARSVLDMGCGSGILSIAAAKLGFAPVAGFDNDPDAVAIAQENARLNATPGLHYYIADVAGALKVAGASCSQGRVKKTWEQDAPATLKPREQDAPATIVVANILAPVLIEHAAAIAQRVARAPNAALLLSGILEEQYPAVLAAYQALGFRERESIQIEIWRSGWLEPVPA